MIEGSISDWRIRAQYEDNPKDEESGEELCGYWQANTLKQQGIIGLDKNLGAIATVNTLYVHEPLHAIVKIFGMEHITHQDIFTIASGLTQFWMTTGLLDPVALEARARRLAADDKDTETLAEEPK
jgi:hypothetical protein